MNGADAPPIAIIGAAGMLGRSLCREITRRGGAVVAFDDVDALDITDPRAVARLGETGPLRAVVNAAAWTDVDGAENDEAAALRINADGPGLLAEHCRGLKVPLVHFSTDYVFDGTASAPIPVDTPPAPINAYGRTKLAGEEAIRAVGGRHLILRTSWLFAAHGMNFVRTMCRLGAERDELRVVDDQWGRPTSCRTLSRITMDLIESDATGTWHAANDGQTTWCGFARAIMQAAGLDCRIEACTTEEFPRPARRPAYGVLDIEPLQKRLGPISPWQDALARCLAGTAPTGA